MTGQHIRFEDGAAYERMMGTWSRLVGTEFLDWLKPLGGQSWLDVGCGNGAFTEQIVERCSPAEIHGVDASEGQLAFARSRPGARIAVFHQGNAMALPFADSRFDVATMALVIFFIPDPAKAISEMARVVKPGGIVATYAWDILGGGFPLEPIHVEMRAMGVAPPLAPHPEAARMDELAKLWSGAGLSAVQRNSFTVHRTFVDFDDFWSISLTSSVGPTIAQMSAHDADVLKTRVRARMKASPSGSVTCEALANAIAGRVPA